MDMTQGWRIQQTDYSCILHISLHPGDKYFTGVESLIKSLLWLPKFTLVETGEHEFLTGRAPNQW